ncbi:hypothetical protein LAV73_04165 [Lysinibacillus xylanilyticus]|uniref:hypothetical protein n=1 Tax=Lysinibacillus xylanilyticus TaxID=582475 RepID=UPI002B24D0FD|nr:hypothetical protein [Lysinibacillus xylanilyticus]MEB2279199.1 hypothetical protein [Lysinibacillus xylanilyticus]
MTVRKRSGSNKCFDCAKAQRQQQMFYLCESEATATNVLSVRKRSDSNNKAPSRNGNTLRYGDGLSFLVLALSLNNLSFQRMKDIVR